MERKIEVAFHPPVVDYLDHLIYTLYIDNYFGFLDSAIEYVDKMVDYIVENIQFKPHKKAPLFFEKYGENLFFITYQPSAAKPITTTTRQQPDNPLNLSLNLTTQSFQLN